MEVCDNRVRQDNPRPVEVAHEYDWAGVSNLMK